MTTMTFAWADVAKELLSRISLHGLTWRHHALGMLQAELSETVRIHVWSPELRVFPQEGYRDVHDHRFDIISYVAVGQICDVRYIVGRVVALATEGSDIVDVCEVTHAKAQREGESDGVVVREGWLRKESEDRIDQGEVYTIPRRLFHTTRVTGLAVTLVHRSNFDDKPARVLKLPGVKLQSGILRHPADDEPYHNLVLRLLTMAEKELRS